MTATTMLCTTTPALNNAHRLPSRHTPSLGGQPASATMLWTQIICAGQAAIHGHLRLLYQRLQHGILHT